MKYLLDVNVLLALGVNQHIGHRRVSAWAASAPKSQYLTCSITELGFVRIAAQTGVYGFTLQQALSMLNQLRTISDLQLSFIPDGMDVLHLPAWVRNSKQTTDGHLVQLAKAHDAVLATLDAAIPGAYLIPGTVSS
ncbi:MAG TPA: hypothetical protein VGF01_04745 [Terracidiphilus sp.]|jgi:hypothetical protein